MEMARRHLHWNAVTVRRLACVFSQRYDRRPSVQPTNHLPEMIALAEAGTVRCPVPRTHRGAPSPRDEWNRPLFSVLSLLHTSDAVKCSRTQSQEPILSGPQISVFTNLQLDFEHPSIYCRSSNLCTNYCLRSFFMPCLNRASWNVREVQSAANRRRKEGQSNSCCAAKEWG